MSMTTVVNDNWIVLKFVDFPSQYRRTATDNSSVLQYGRSTTARHDTPDP